MKKIIKAEIVVLTLLVLVAAAMTLISAGGLSLLKEPVTLAREATPIPTDAPAMQEEALPMEVSQEEVPAQISTGRQLTATRYFVYDVRQEKYLQQKGELDQRLYPASITKLLTVYVLLQYMEPSQEVVVGDALTLVQPDSSLANLQEGDRLTVGQLIEAMMLPSGNDAAQTAAVAAGRVIANNTALTPQEASSVFVDEMNKQAQFLGMTGSHFANADGFHDDNHYTTMADLTVLAKKVLADPTIVSYTSLISDTVTLQGRTEEWKNTNVLLNPNSESYIPATIGLKTGYTSNAGSCLMSAFFMKDRLMIIGVFGCPAYTEDRYLDTVELFNTTQI